MTTAPFERTTCACPECVACCKRQPGPLAPGDFERIAALLGETLEVAARHFWASPGALVLESGTGRPYRIGTITPRYVEGRCVFLDEQDRCRIHAAAPAGCALFDVHMDAREGGRRATWLVREQLSPAYQALRDTLPLATYWQPR